MDFNSSVIVFFFNFYQRPEKIQADQGGFASLKGKGRRMSHLIQRLFHENIQSLFGHHSIGFFLTVIHFIRIKTITAAEIAASGRRFDQQGNSWLFWHGNSSSRCI